MDDHLHFSGRSQSVVDDLDADSRVHSYVAVRSSDGTVESRVPGDLLRTSSKDVFPDFDDEEDCRAYQKFCNNLPYFSRARSCIGFIDCDMFLIVFADGTVQWEPVEHLYTVPRLVDLVHQFCAMPEDRRSSTTQFVLGDAPILRSRVFRSKPHVVFRGYQVGCIDSIGQWKFCECEDID